MLWGYHQLYGLKSADGYLCHLWWASDRVGLILFLDPKSASKWLKEVNKLAKKHKRPDWEVTAQVVIIKEVPEGLQPTINPADEYADVNRIVGRKTWRNW